MDPRFGSSPSDHATKARKIVLKHYNDNLNRVDRDKTIDLDDVYVVMFTYVLGNWKALVSTTVPDNMYYEVTYSREMRETYLDAYRKNENKAIGDEDYEANYA